MKRIVVIFFIFLTFLIPSFVFAVPFGGRVLFTLPCTMTSRGIPGLYIYVGPPQGGALIYAPGFSVLHANYAPGVPGSWELGDYSPVGFCVLGVCPACTVLPAIGTISKFGTS